MEGIVFKLHAKIEAVRHEGTEQEQFIDPLVAPMVLVSSDDLIYTMLGMWAATEGEHQPDPEDVCDAAERILGELEDGKFEWVARHQQEVGDE